MLHLTLINGLSDMSQLGQTRRRQQKVATGTNKVFLKDSTLDTETFAGDVHKSSTATEVFHLMAKKKNNPAP